jgi:Leucine-rich repeat (LRR) protein
MNLFQELQEKLSEHNPTEVDELILDDLFENVNNFSENNKKDLEKYSNLIHLSLNGFGLESLKNFPKLPTLQVLEIRQNNLSGKDFDGLKDLYPELYKLKVGENPIKSLEVFSSLADSSIKKIELVDTPASETKEYRKGLFTIMSNLEIIDNQTKDGDDASSTIYEDDEGMEDDEGFEDDEFDGEDEEFEEYDDDEEGEEESEGKKE